MAQLQLTSEEGDILVEILESYLSDIRMEIADTDSTVFKVDLKKKKEVIKKILDNLHKSRGG